jgi:hypothetical protein
MDNNFDNWRSLLEEYEKDLFFDKKDKRLEDWIQILTDLPSIHSSSVSFNNKVAVFGSWNGNDQQIANKLLLKLLPWRKGPFLIQDIFIDSEWKSDLKWTRFLDLGVNLFDKNILDVKNRVSGISKTFEQVSDALKKSASDIFSCKLVPLSLNENELKLCQKLANEKFSDKNWTFKR